MSNLNDNTPRQREGGALPPNLARLDDAERDDDEVIDDEQMEARYDELERQDAKANGRMRNDAVVIGDLVAPEMQAALGVTTAVLTADHHRVPGKNWKRKEGTVQEILDGPLTRHPVEAEKHGFSLCYGVSGVRKTHTGTDGVKVRLAPRLKDEIAAIHSFAVDVDGTEKVAVVRDRLTAAGYLAVIYTTHSHAEKKTEQGDRFRVVVFFKEPFVFPHPSANMRKLPKDQQQERVDAIKLYEAIYTGIAEEIVRLDDFDDSGMKLNQIQHPPRRPADADEWFHYVIAGELLDWKIAPQGDASKYRKNEARVSGNHADLTGRKTGEPAILSDGFDVRDWWDEFGELISVEHLLDMLGWETRGSSNGGMTILCPNDANHSNPGDDNDTGCWAKGDGDGEDRFIITCQHNNCYKIYTWDHLKLMEDAILAGEAVLPDEYDTFSELLCDPSLYPDDVEGEEVEPPHPSDFGAEVVIEISFLSSARAVKKAFEAALADAHAGDDHFAALYAGVAKSQNKPKVVEKLDELMLTIKDRFDGNARKRLKKRGEEMLKADNAAYAAKKAEEEKQQIEEQDKEAVAAGELLPAIHTDDGFLPMVAQTVDHLAAMNEQEPVLFIYMDRLADVRDGKDGTVRIKSLDLLGVREVLSRVAEYQKTKKVGEDYITTSVAPPKDVVENILHRSPEGFAKNLRGVTNAPFYSKEGTIVTENGYHAESELVLRLPQGLRIPAIPAHPTSEEARAAARYLIEEVCADLPFGGLTRAEIMEKAFDDGVPAVAHYLAMILQQFMREMISGPTPLYVLNKPAPGTGASLAADLSAIITTGSTAPAWAMPFKKEEVGKTLTTALAGGGSIILFDNIAENVDSEEWALAITQSPYQARILGRTEAVSVDVLATWIATANHLTMATDLIRRSALIDLDAKDANPSKRTPKGGWRHPQIKDWTKKNRGELVVACLTIIQHWIAEGKQPDRSASLASFESWAETMGGVLRAAGVAGFLGNVDMLWEETADPSADMVGILLTELASYDSGAKFRPGSAADGAKSLMDILNDGCEASGGKPILISGWGYNKEDACYVGAGTIGQKFREVARKPHRVIREGVEIEIRFDRQQDKKNGGHYYVMQREEIGPVAD